MKDRKISAFLAVFFAFLLTIYFVLSAPFGFPENKIFEIRKGATLTDVAEKLDGEKFIRSKTAFIFFVKLFKDEKSVKAGLYYFERPLGLIEIANRLADGKNGIGLAGITVIEGQTLHDIGNIFEKNGKFQAKEIWEITGSPAAEKSYEVEPRKISDYGDEFSFLTDKPKNMNLEGYLFPDTYFFPPNIGPENVIRAMLENFDHKLTMELRAQIAEQKKSIFEVITMASIIEREARDSEDRKIISGILWKRASAGMVLQADATLNYLTGKKSSELTVEDIQIDSPYNTYKYPGLPAGPISNPGLDSIQAAIFPNETPYWFYLHDSSGNAHYAKTFEEHKKNKERYLR